MWMGFLRREDRGQDLSEYCLIVAVLALLAMSLFLNVSGGLQGLWNSAGNALTAANTTLLASGATAGTGGATGSGSAGGDGHFHNNDGRGDGRH